MDKLLSRVRTLVEEDLNQAVHALEAKNWTLAIVCLEKAYGRMTLLEDDELKYQILYNLMEAYFYSTTDGYKRVEECYQEMLRLKVIHCTLQPEILRLRGISFARRGLFEESVQTFLQMVQIVRGRDILQGWAYLSDLYLLQYYFTTEKTLNLAKHYVFRILDECTQKPILRREKAWGFRQLGRIFFAEKQFTQALSYFREQLDLIDDKHRRYQGYLDLADTFLAMHLSSRGVKYLKEAEIFFRRHDNAFELGQALLIKGKYYIHEGQQHKGQDYFEEALELFYKTEEWEQFYLTLQEMNRVAANKNGQMLDLHSDLIWLLQSYILQDVKFA